MISVKVLADSISPCGTRLVTVEETHPRSIHAELMTHRELSRNAASSRAIPTAKLVDMVLSEPFIPAHIGANQKGMQAGEQLADDVLRSVRQNWLDLRDQAVGTARILLDKNVHKQVINRCLEPWMWITCIVSTTSLDNLLALRDHPSAEPHFQDLAKAWKAATDASTPKRLAAGAWHRPLIDYSQDVEPAREIVDEIVRENTATPWAPGHKIRLLDTVLNKASAGRCARVSYLTHAGKRDLREDIALHDRLVGSTPLHASPMEHVAKALDYPEWYKNDWFTRVENLNPYDLQHDVHSALTEEEPNRWVRDSLVALAQIRSGNFLGWRQYRKTLQNECAGGVRP